MVRRAIRISMVRSWCRMNDRCSVVMTIGILFYLLFDETMTMMHHLVLNLLRSNLNRFIHLGSRLLRCCLRLD